MALDFGVSRTSIREAVKTLEAGGVVVVKKALGIFVAENPGVSADPLGMVYVQNKKQMMLDWYRVRLALEPEIVRMVVTTATDAQIREIALIERKEAEAIRSGMLNFLDIDRRFHLMLAKATHNEVMERLIPSLQKSVYYGIAGTPYEVFSKRVRDNALAMHEQIVRFIEKRDEAGAVLAMRYHLLQAIEDTALIPSEPPEK
jgi:DNA-binding FadR family transcriptional regulator